MKRFGFFVSLLVASSFFIAGCGGSSSVDSTEDTPQSIAIDKIKAYAEDQTQPVPMVEDYEDAGVVGVTADNLDDINALVASLTQSDVDTPEEIQAILDEYELTIVDPNTAPVANAGIDQSVATSETVTLNGSASSDADGDTLTYLWSLTTLPSGSTTTLSSTTVVSPTFIADVAGTYVASLIVNDGTVNSIADTVTVTAADPVAENTVPVANAGIDQSVATSETVTLNGSASSDADGDTLTYLWSLTTLPSGSTTTLSSTTVVSPTFIADVAGTYVASLVVNDGTEDSNADTVTVTAADPVVENTAPVAVATADPTSVNISTDPNALITLDGSASSDADSDTLTYLWSLTKPAGSTAVLSSTTALSPTFTVDIVGSYVATLVVNDGTVDSNADTVTIAVNDGTVDEIVGKTLEFSDVSGASFSFYQNNKFVKTTCINTCTDGTGTFAFIGTWSGTTSGTDATGLALLDDLGNPINVTTITSSKDIYYYPIVADKDLENNVQGDGVRERKSDGSIKFVYFRDPDLSGVTAFSYFGFDTNTWDPIGAGGHWQVRDGKVYAYYGTTLDNEISTYAFDRKPIKNEGGPILTVTKGGDLIDVIAVDEYWQLKPSATIDKTVEVTPVDMVKETFYDKLMLISDKIDGPSGCYFDAPLSELVNGYVTCAGISIDGSVIWGGKGDNWYINADHDLETKIHYEVAGSNSTTEIWRFNEATPDQGTLVSKYNKEGVFVTTSSLTDFRDF